MRAVVGSIVLGCALMVGCGGSHKGKTGSSSADDHDAGDASVPSQGTDGSVVGSGGTGGIINDDGGAAGSGTQNGPDAGLSAADQAKLGDFCDTSADCGKHQVCLTESGNGWLGGGPAGGVCVISCATDSTACQQVPGSVCVTGSSNAEAYCFEGCQRGPTLPGDSKCHTRVNSACFQLSDTASACLPTCGYDGECPEGRVCDINSGVCVDQAPAGLPLGSACDPNAAQNPCAGFCVTLDTGYSVCSGFCTLGSTEACGVDPTAPIPSGAGTCLPLFDTQNDDIGDTGLCVQRCDCNGTCATDAAICSPFNDPDTESQLQAKGLCIPPAANDTGLVCSATDGGNADH